MSKFVVIAYYGDVYGVFDTYDAAVAWAMVEAKNEGLAWIVKEIIDVKETP